IPPISTLFPYTTLFRSLLKNIFLYLSYRISNPVRNNISSGFRLQLYDKILRLPVGFFTDQRKGDIMSRMIGDIAEINGAVVGSRSEEHTSELQSPCNLV